MATKNVMIGKQDMSKFEAVCNAIAGVFSSPLGDTARKSCNLIRNEIPQKWDDKTQMVVKVSDNDGNLTHHYTSTLGAFRALLSASEGIKVLAKPKRGRTARTASAPVNWDSLSVS